TSDAFVSALNAGGTALAYSSYLGTTGQDAGNAIALDPGGNAYVTGSVGGSGLLIRGSAYQSTVQGGPSDAFLAQVSSVGGLTYSSYLGGGPTMGGTGADVGYGIALDPGNQPIITGQTASTNLTTVNALSGGTALSGSTDAFLAWVSLTTGMQS